jgi:hypothetical protein
VIHFGSRLRGGQACGTVGRGHCGTAILAS